MLQNSAFIEDVYSTSDDESEVENVSRNQWERLDETISNEVSSLGNRTVSIGNGSVNCENIDDNGIANDSGNAHSKSNGSADDSVIVIDDD